MQITNNYQPNFKSGRVDKAGQRLLSKRLKAGELDKFIDRFVKTHEGTSYNVVLGAIRRTPSKFDTLDACITYDKTHFRHLEEGIISGVFLHPKSFMVKLNNQIRKDLISIATNGHIYN